MNRYIRFKKKKYIENQHHKNFLLNFILFGIFHMARNVFLINMTRKTNINDSDNE